MAWPLIARRDCSRRERELILYHYGEASPEQRRRLEEHLERCARCRAALAGLRDILPLAVARDEPPLEFWETYTQELQRKIDAIESKRSLGERLRQWLLPWPLPALATLLVVAIGIGVTLSDRLRPSRTTPDEEMLRVLPIAENLEFYRSLDFLDSLDLLESQRSNSRNSQA